MLGPGPHWPLVLLGGISLGPWGCWRGPLPHLPHLLHGVLVLAALWFQQRNLEVLCDCGIWFRLNSRHSGAQSMRGLSEGHFVPLSSLSLFLQSRLCSHPALRSFWRASCYRSKAQL
ncbi:unnamed protein product [Gadus morhua 'NCC']